MGDFHKAPLGKQVQISRCTLEFQVQHGGSVAAKCKTRNRSAHVAVNWFSVAAKCLQTNLIWINLICASAELQHSKQSAALKIGWDGFRTSLSRKSGLSVPTSSLWSFPDFFDILFFLINCSHILHIFSC